MTEPGRQIGAVAMRAAQAARIRVRPPGPPVRVVADVEIADRPARIYRPDTAPRPIVLFLHGGAFVIGGLDSHDVTCRRLALAAGTVVVALDYRLAPEHPAPAAIDDAVAAGRRLAESPERIGGDPACGLALAGDSSGGTVALLAACRLRTAGVALSGLLLACPNADLTLSLPSVREKGRGRGLDADDLRWCISQWVPDAAMRTDPVVSPLHADVRGLPRTLLATAEHDPLHDEGVALAERLHAAGVRVEHVPHPGLTHGFVTMAGTAPEVDEATEVLFARFGTLLRADRHREGISPPGGELPSS